MLQDIQQDRSRFWSRRLDVETDIRSIEASAASKSPLRATRIRFEESDLPETTNTIALKTPAIVINARQSIAA
jgi:hypothetical protein